MIKVMKENVNEIKWLKLDKENRKPILYVELHLKSEIYILNLIIDSYTYNNFLETLKQIPFNEKYGSNYNYWFDGYSVNKSEEIYYHTVIIKLGKKRHKHNSYCSEIFCQNIKWLLEVKNKNEITRYLVTSDSN
jgi:hypothetical protein